VFLLTLCHILWLTYVIKELEMKEHEEVFYSIQFSQSGENQTSRMWHCVGATCQRIDDFTVEAPGSSETLVPIYHVNWCHTPEDSDCHIYCWDNLKPQTSNLKYKAIFWCTVKQFKTMYSIMCSMCFHSNGCLIWSSGYDQWWFYVEPAWTGNLKDFDWNASRRILVHTSHQYSEWLLVEQ
jgi:hypothetical protein